MLFAFEKKQEFHFLFVATNVSQRKFHKGRNDLARTHVRGYNR